MLSGLNKGMRLRAAVMLTVLYAICVLAPSAALAFSPRAAHCLTGTQTMAHVHPVSEQATAHAHDDDTAHSHADAGATNPSQSDEKGRSGDCCGLFCASALAHAPIEALPALHTPALAGPALTFQLHGCGPDRIHRPPRA